MEINNITLHMKNENICFEMGTTLTKQNSIQEEIKSKLKSGNACNHSVQNLVCQFAIQKCKN